MSFWLVFVIAMGIGAAPAVVAQPRFRPWWARRWWQLTVGLILVGLVLPFGIVLILFIIDSAWEAIGEVWALWSGDFREVAAFALGWLAGASAMAWRHRQAPYLEGPSLSEDTKTLARDPDKHAEAVRRYRLESGVDMAVAIDVVEQFGRTPEGAPLRKPPGALEWMYFGFAAAWYAVFAAFYVVTFSSQGNHVLAALGCFLFFPALFSGFCGLCGGTLSAGRKAALSEAWERGTLTRRRSFLAGTAAGVLSIVTVLGGLWLLYPLAQSEVILVGCFIWVGAILSGAPYFGLWLMRGRTNSLSSLS